MRNNGDISVVGEQMVGVGAVVGVAAEVSHQLVHLYRRFLGRISCRRTVQRGRDCLRLIETPEFLDPASSAHISGSYALDLVCRDGRKVHVVVCHIAVSREFHEFLEYSGKVFLDLREICVRIVVAE